MKYNLYLDDFRVPEDSFLYTYNKVYLDLKWEIVRTYQDFVNKITKDPLPYLISFDHDLNDLLLENNNKEKTGYDCAKYLTEYCYINKMQLPNFLVHSQNPVGKENILKLLKTFANEMYPISKQICC